MVQSTFVVKFGEKETENEYCNFVVLASSLSARKNVKTSSVYIFQRRKQKADKLEKRTFFFTEEAKAYLSQRTSLHLKKCNKPLRK